MNIRNRNKNASLTRHRVIERKCFSSHNLRDGKKASAIFIKSGNNTDNINKKFHTLRIKSVYKINDI